MPAPHGVAPAAPSPHQLPATHGSHAVAFGDDWNSPAAHSTHALRPAAPLKEPGGQWIGAVARATQKLPAGHATHDDCSASRWYSPGSQPVHVSAPATEALPAAHVSGAVAPAPHAEPAGHAAQSATDVAFAVPFHVPAGHSRASELPSSQYAPGEQGSGVTVAGSGHTLPAGQGLKHVGLPW